VRLARDLQPDVCLFDIRMPLLDGLEATRLVAGPGVADPMVVVVITTFDLDEYVYGALRAGARGFLLKDAGPELLVQAVRTAADGEALIAPSVTVRLLQAFADVPVGRPAAQPISPVTAREEEVLLAVARGLTNTEIADALHISLSPGYRGTLAENQQLRERCRSSAQVVAKDPVHAPVHRPGQTDEPARRKPRPAW
jgi:DNA-binding NarL/FixJ family response regulator